ncbi:MAG: hypothetical protein ACYCV0_01995, partial [Desulfitobacteriaceae bacterium]
KQGTPAEVFGDPELIRESFLRLPRIAHLWEVLAKREGFPAEKLPLTIREARQAFSVLKKVTLPEKELPEPYESHEKEFSAEMFRVAMLSLEEAKTL